MENKQVLNEKDLEKVAGGSIIEPSFDPDHPEKYSLTFECINCHHVRTIICYKPDLDWSIKNIENMPCTECGGSYKYVSKTSI